MNVLLLVHHFPPRFWGGGELRTYETARWLLQNGHRVNVICIESISDGDGKSLRWKDDIFEGIPVRRLIFNLALTPDPFLYSYLNPLIGNHLRTFLAETEPDLLHLVGGYLVSASPLFVAQEMNVPTVVTLLEFWFLCAVNILLRGDGSLCGGPFDLIDCARCVQDSKRRYRIPDQLSPNTSRAFWHFAAAHTTLGSASGLTSRLSKLEHRRSTLMGILAQTNAVISPSQYVAGIFELNGISQDNFRVIGHVEDGMPVKTRWGKVPSKSLRFAYLGQITKMKGVDNLVEAFLSVKSVNKAASLKIYGNLKTSDDFSRRLQALAHGAPQIVFAGTYDREQVYEVLREVDVLVFPSIWYENAPRVIREAFETGTPVIAANLGGAAEYVNHGHNGLLYERGNVRDLTRQLQRVVDEPELLEQLQGGIPRIKSLEMEMKELIEVYQSVVNSHMQVASA